MTTPLSRPVFPCLPIALVAGLTLACDPVEDLEAADLDLVAAAEPADEVAVPEGPEALGAPDQDPEEGLLCILCVLGGNNPVCGDDNVTHDNACWAGCAGAEVVHAGACACGDGYALGDEACDDGDADNTDACTDVCEEAACGDGYVQAGETCDDGNVEADDGCSATCQEEVVCLPGPGTLDQANLGGAYAGLAFVASQVAAGQSVTIGRDGVLTAVEINLQRCNYTLTGSLVELTLRDADDALLATRTVPADTFPIHCGDGSPLDAEELGAGAFDLSDACITVSEGQVLKAYFRLLDAPTGSCQGGQCTNAIGEFSCVDDSDCQPHLEAPLSEDTYAGGTGLSGGLPIASEDFRFKVLVD